MSSPDKEQLDFAEDSTEILRSVSFRHAPLGALYFGIPPLLVFLSVGACVHRTGLWALALAVGFVVEFTVTTLWAPTMAALMNSRSAIAWFSQDATHGDALWLHEIAADELSNCIPSSIADQLQSKYKYEFLNTRLGRRLAGLDPQFLPLRVFIVETNILASIRSYGSLRSTSFIFVTDHPSSQVMMDRFKFYHELSHTSYIGCITFSRRYSKTFLLLLAAAVIAAMTPFSLALIAVIAFLVLRAWWSWTGAPIDREMHADRSALGALGDAEHAEEIVSVFRAVWQEDRFGLYVAYGRQAMMERDFRIWNMEDTVRAMKRAGGKDQKAVPLPGRDRIPLVLATYFAAGWAGWHSLEAAGLGLATVVGTIFVLCLTIPWWQRLLLMSERALEQAVKQRIQRPA